MAQSLIDQHKELEAAAEGYSKLRDESKLTTKEFGELLDIRKEMASNPEEEAFKELDQVAEMELNLTAYPDEYSQLYYEALSEEVDDSTVKTDWHKSFSRQLVAATGGGGGVEG